ncbi:hypothetical protein FA13DRAFT_115928 [Coprinellus micaceus]|uniref:Septin-type G domain-containing protein n=1 Tax=Coprinellus micaceus TaxID=71717 RepID=A0A4Y7TIV1_COPMI|nr:hypothetical protein FA13DRAFT_115928 [Coprinellus micaceus]
MATTSQDVGAPREFMLSNSNGVAVQHFGLGTGKVAGERNEAPSGTTVPFQLRPTDVVVLVMGIVGAGRSTFINALLPANHMEKKMAVGPSGSLAACTKTAECVVLDSDDLALILGHKPNYRLVLVDTPGFDSADKTDSDGVLKEIVEWSKSWYAFCRHSESASLFLQVTTWTEMLWRRHFYARSFHRPIPSPIGLCHREQDPQVMLCFDSRRSRNFEVGIP